MPLTPDQIAELNAASTREGGQTDIDKANIDYATKTYGYKPPTPPIPGLGDTSKNPVSDSNAVRNGVNLTKSAAGDLTGVIDALSSTINSGVVSDKSKSDLDTAMADKEKVYASMGITTAEEMAAAEAAGIEAGIVYDPMIAEAQSKSEQGQASALVGAGERGGLMSSQYAGIAALAPTVGKSFVGAGGELERVASAYDLNIQKIKIQKEVAISEAKAAALKAQKTGKQQDYDNAQSRVDDFRKLIQDEQDAITNKINWIKGVQDIKTQQAADLEKSAVNAASSLVTIDEEGNIVIPDQKDISEAAKNTGIDEATLTRYINDRAAEIQKMNQDEMRAEKASQSPLRTEWQDMVDTGAYKGNLTQYAAFKATQYGTENKSGPSATVTGLSKNDEKLFTVSVANAKAALAADPTLWGQYWSGIKNQFPNVPNSTIDTYLGGGYNEQSGQWWGMANPEQAKTITTKGANQTAANIDPTTKSSLVDDINQGATIDELINAYPEVNTTLINQMYKAINS